MSEKSDAYRLGFIDGYVKGKNEAKEQKKCEECMHCESEDNFPYCNAWNRPTYLHWSCCRVMER